MRALGVDPVHDTRSTFRALVGAMARPGTVESVPAAPADHAVLATLVDHEVTLHTEDDELREALSNAGRYEPAPLERADVIHVRGSTDERITDAERGTLKEPSDGAIAVYRVDGLAEGPAGDEESEDGRSLPDDAVALRVAGPGVPGRQQFRVAGVPETEVGAIADVGDEFPRGVEAVFAAEETVAALPRSVSVEVA
jgi:alpha-D-ribose 1-methylphosphonate 5-triphosphate synthase subunit PhnH